MPFFSEQIDAVLSGGHSLAANGENNWALDRAAALAALQQLADAGVPVLGGDVYTLAGGRPEPTYDNWFCNREAGEAADAFVQRSVAVAHRYITSYGGAGGGDAALLFSIVPGS